jgi:hypothetical protein
MAKKEQTPDPYGTLFDFVFAAQKKGKRKGRPSDWSVPPVTSGLAEGLVHIAAAPGQYAVESLMKDMNDEANALQVAKVQPTRGYNVYVGGLGGMGMMLTDPRKYFSIRQKKYKDGKKYARVGGGSRVMDSAIFALMAKSSGLDNSTAAGFGFNLFQQDIPLYTNAFGSEASHLSRYIRSQEAMRVMSETYGMKYHQVTKDEMEQIVSASYNAGAFAPPGTARNDMKKGDKDARLDHMKQALVTKGLSQDEAEWAAEDFWGSRNDDDDMGLWLTDEKKDDKTEEERIRKKSLDALLWKVQMIKDREPDPAKKARLTAFQRRVSEYAQSGKTLPFALGTHIGRIYHIQGWIRSAGDPATKILLNGRVDELLKQLNMGGGLNYYVTGLVGKVGGADKYGANIFLRPSLPAGATPRSRDIYIQRFTAAMFYFHPVNVVKGMIWDGRYWAWLAKRAEDRGNMSRRDLYKKIAARYPRSVMNRMSRWLESKTVGNLKSFGYKALEKAGFFRWAAGKLGREVIGLPVREIVKQLLIKGITVLVGATVLPGIGGIIGFVADQIINIGISIASKFIKPVFEVGILLFWGILALLLITGFVFVDGTKKKMHRYVNPPINAVAPAQGGPFDEEDWAEESTPPDDYDGTCFASGGIRCTQGPCGSFSHLENGDRAVDLVWGGMTSSSGIRAPADGKVLSSSVYNTRCEDGTMMGGIVYFRDSSGYTWIFVHAKPVATGSVSAGETIGIVQTKPETQEGDCWTGAHAHVMIRDPSGQLVNAEQFLNSEEVGCSFVCPPEDAC